MSAATIEPANKAEAGSTQPGGTHKTSTAVLAAFAAVYFLWGGTFLAVRFGIESFPPLLLGGTRHLLAGLILYPLFRWKSGIRPTAANWRTAAITGVLLLFAGNGAVCWAEQTVSSGVTALLVATVCLWLVILEWMRPGGTRPGARVVIGIIIGFAGLGLLVGPAYLGGSQRINPTGAGVLVAGALFWAWGSLYSRHGQMPTSPLLGAGMQCLCGGATLWLVGLLIGEGRHLHPAAISLRSWLSLTYLVIFGTGVGFTAYIYILKKSTPVRVGTYAFVNPVVALFLGWALAREAVTMRTGIAAAIILTAVILVITAPHKDPAEAADAIPVPDEA